MFKLVYYVPESHLEATKQAVFRAGAGRFTDAAQQVRYQNCAWQVKGIGQFTPMDGARPTLGTVGQAETLEEWRVEILLPEERARAVKAALLAAHPYEEAAYEFYRIAEIG